MVRAGVVKHSSERSHGGCNEIQAPLCKNVIIAYDRLYRPTGDVLSIVNSLPRIQRRKVHMWAMTDMLWQWGHLSIRSLKILSIIVKLEQYLLS
jgi:hypothetical protein